MTFKYFANPTAFSYLAVDGQRCHFCRTSQDCLDGAHLFGQQEITAICFACMKAGRLVDLDISANEISPSALDPTLLDVGQVSREIIYCTPSLPTWQDCSWPVKNGKPYRFMKIAAKLDYDSQSQFTTSLLSKSDDPEWLWDMLPDHKVENMKDGQYDVSCYLFELEGKKLTIWDAS